jgi:DNA-directed RNA polymerase specialized sigma24 family protein
VEPADLRDNSAFIAMFDAHAAYLYDYCLNLLGNEEEAVGATRVTLVAAFMLGGRMRESDRQRAWLFALARRECLSESPTRHQPWIAPVAPKPPPSANGTTASVAFAEAETTEMPRQGFDAEKRRAVRVLAREMAPHGDLHREVPSLVHRYGIRSTHVASILEISPDAAREMLASVPTAQMEQFGQPLASLPASVWRETASVIFDSGQREYREAIASDAGRLWTQGLESATPPSGRKLALTSVGLAVALLAPTALGAAIYAFYATSPAAAAPAHQIIVPTATPGRSTSVPDATVARSTKTKVHQKTTHHSRVSVHSLPTTKPGTSTSVSPSHRTKPSPTPSSSAPVIGPSPGPSSTSPTSPTPSDHSSSPSPPPSSPAPSSSSSSAP